jgi:hypothetical protein
MSQICIKYPQAVSSSEWQLPEPPWSASASWDRGECPVRTKISLKHTGTGEQTALAVHDIWRTSVEVGQTSQHTHTLHTHTHTTHNKRLTRPHTNIRSYIYTNTSSSVVSLEANHGYMFLLTNVQYAGVLSQISYHRIAINPI